jgi:hypothetical protein
MKCEFCGEEISPGAFACPRCGGPVSKLAGEPSPGAAGAEGQSGASPGPKPGIEEKPPDPPLARAEEDFIALAEETIVLDEQPGAAPAYVDPLAVPAVAEAADQPILPGAPIPADQYGQQTALTGGYKGPEASSVAGAGKQTADDPFGLNITEKAPSETDGERVVWARSWRYSSWWNMTMMIVGIVILIAGIGAAVYFGFLRKSSPGGDPSVVLRDYVEQVVTGKTENLSKISVPGSSLAGNLATLLTSYKKSGAITLKSFETRPVKVAKDSATLQITKLDIEMLNEQGARETLPVLEITEPFQLLQLYPTVEVIKQNGNWMVKS